MPDTFFFCDLDNTLLYSCRHRQAGDVCVEWLKGKPQGFMTPKTIELLGTLPSDVRLIPVTTRSVEQYRRIQWPEGREPQMALVTNGAILLEHGEPSSSWSEATGQMIDAWGEDVHSIQERLEESHDFIRCRLVDGAYVFVYVKDGIDSHACASHWKAFTRLQVIASGKKIYFMPPGLDKGTAVERFCQGRPHGRVLAAGDSGIDVPMLARADWCAVPHQSLADLLTVPRVDIASQSQNFAEFILSRVPDVTCVR